MKSITVQRLPRRSPDGAGLDRTRLDAMREVVRDWGIRSVLVVKDGCKVWEWHESGRDRPGALYSCTKGVLSTLIGIALDEGRIRSVDDPIGDYLELESTAPDKLGAVKLKHLLAMTPGFDWPDFDKPYNEMKQADDWVKYVLNRELVHKPGEAFTYNSGASHLLSAILAKVADKPILHYAYDVLFDPLGIRSVKWSEHGGLLEGGTGLHLTAANLAKLGVLYAAEGEWRGQRIVSAEWVKAATRPHSKGLVNYKPSIYGQYGYHWWVSAGQPETIPPYYFAFGYGGQYMAVAPESGLVAVIRKSLSGRNNAILSRQLLHDYIFPSLSHSN